MRAAVLLPLAAAPISRWKRGGEWLVAGFLVGVLGSVARGVETAEPGGRSPLELVDAMAVEG
jgi:hypothetical protein